MVVGTGLAVASALTFPASFPSVTIVASAGVAAASAGTATAVGGAATAGALGGAAVTGALSAAAATGALGAASTGALGGAITAGALGGAAATGALGGAAATGALGSAAAAGTGIGIANSFVASSLAAGPLGWVLLGAKESCEGITLDCWKLLVHDTSQERSRGMLLKDLFGRSEIASVRITGDAHAKNDLPDIVVTNVWDETFHIDFLRIIKTNEIVCHARPILD